MKINRAIKIISALVLMTVLCVLSTLSFAQQSGPLDCVELNDSHLTRPDPENKVTPVDIAVYVLNIQNVDDIEQKYTLDFILKLTWKDPRLVHAGGDRGSAICRYPLGHLWDPEIQIFNIHGVNKLLPDDVEVDSDGTVVYRQRFYGSLVAPLNLQNFPFDEQYLPIEFISIRYGPEKIDLRFDAKTTGRAPTFTVSDWVIGEGEATIGKFTAVSSHVYGAGGEFASFEYAFKSHRILMYYVWKVILPMMLILFMSWAVFWVDPIKIEVQIGLSATTILTMIAFLFSLNNLLPRISYLTRLDFYIFTSIVLVFMSFIEATLTCSLAMHGRVDLAKRIDRYARVIFPSSYLVMVTLFFFNV